MVANKAEAGTMPKRTIKASRSSFPAAAAEGVGDDRPDFDC
jgi:hypothetical protein